MFRSLLSSLSSLDFSRTRQGRPRRSTRLCFEDLEQRLMPTLVPTNPYGLVEGDVVRIDHSLGTHQTAARAGNGDCAVVWSEAGGGIYARLFTPDGAPFTNTLHIDGTGSADDEAAVGMNDSGEFVVAWVNHSSDTKSDVYAERFNSSGEANGGPISVATADVEDSPAVGIDAAGNFIVAYDHVVGGVGQVQATLFDANGTATQTVSAVPGDSRNEYQPDVAMNAAGDFVLAYTVDVATDNSDVEARAFFPSGDERSNDIPVATSSHQEWKPAVAMNASGAFVVSYTYVNSEDDETIGAFTYRHYATDVYAERFDADGTNRSSVVVSGPNQDADASSVAFDDRGNYIIAYQGLPQKFDGDYSHGNPHTVYVQPVDSNDLVETTPIEIPVTVVDSAAYQENVTPTAVLDDAGNATLVWINQSNDLGRESLMARQVYLQSFKTSAFRIDATLPAGSSDVTLTNGTSETISVTIHRDPAFTGPIDLSVGGALPADVHWSASPADPSNPAVETRTLSLTADTSLAANEVATVSVHAESGSLPTVDLPMTLRVTAGRITDVAGVFTPDGAPRPELVPGMTITIEGQGFASGDQVLFTAAPGHPQLAVAPSSAAVDGTSLTVVVPSQIASGTVAVTTPAGALFVSPAVYDVTPGAVTTVDPLVGTAPQELQPGSTITVTGYGLVPGSLVQFGAFPLSRATPTFIDPSGTLLRVQVPSDAADGPLTIVKPDGTTFASADSVHIFSYNSLDSFNFHNFTFSVSFPLVANAFGDQCYVNIGPFATPIPSPDALAFTALCAQAGFGNNGACFGMSVMSDQLAQNPDQITGFYGLPAGQAPLVNNLQANGNLISAIEQKHLLQWSAEMLKYSNNAHDNASVSALVRALLAKEDEPIITLRYQNEGHALVCYDVQPTATGYDLCVYDPNRPFVTGEQTDGGGRWLMDLWDRIHVTGDSWNFVNADSSWNGTLTDLNVIPFSALPENPSLPDDGPGLFTLIFGSNAANAPVAFVDDAGVLNVNGFRLDATTPAVIGLGATAAGGTQVTADGQVFSYAPGTVKAVTIYGGTGSGTIDLAQTRAGVPVTVYDAAGTKTVNIGTPDGALDAIQGDVTVIGGTGTNAVNVNDRAAPAGGRYTLTSSEIQRSGTAAIHLEAIQSAHLLGGAGAQSYDVEGLNPNVNLTLELGSAASSVSGPAASSSALHVDAVAPALSDSGATGTTSTARGTPATVPSPMANSDSLSRVPARRLVLHAPRHVSLPHDGVLTFRGHNRISVSYSDQAPGQVQVAVSVHHGILSLAGSTGTRVAGNHTNHLTLHGTPAALNRALSRLTLRASRGFAGADSLQVHTVSLDAESLNDEATVNLGHAR
jgi:hypothetical protein